MLSVVRLGVVMLGVVMLNGVAPAFVLPAETPILSSWQNASFSSSKVLSLKR